MSLFIDGAPATADDLAHPALVNHGAYTSFRVEHGAARGLDLHLVRLETASVELFGQTVGEDRLRELMRAALGDRRDAWLRVSLFSPEISHRQVAWVGRPRVMIGVFDPPLPLGPRRVMPVAYLREAPHLKHVATMGLIRARRAASQAGFDDALFTDADGRILEGTLWNVGFVKGDEVVWPEGPKLEGVAQALIRRNLAAVGLIQNHAVVRLSDLPTFHHAFLCNSATPAAALTAVGDHVFDPAPEVVARLAAAWSAAPPEKI
ncbi:aminotransferase class IV [Brevundimonas sp.]|jgi:branched-subunit amino acid aminotransferase/4-amino-4-deoxychorismate lyase|uniref:aminotransferase class IV n=1 Tax=Brevundimonas sp. TaxID=1871086 RepID=UPI002E14A6C6|nr:aminotransferase class IV [Brevundimonas sp.]